MSDHLAVPGSSIDAREIFFQSTPKQRPVRNIDEKLSDEPDAFFRRHPTAAIEPREVHRLRVAPQSAFAAQIEVGVEITQGQLAESAVDRFATAAAGEIRFRD